jgi:hypothetical protein
MNVRMLRVSVCVSMCTCSCVCACVPIWGKQKIFSLRIEKWWSQSHSAGPSLDLLEDLSTDVSVHRMRSSVLM